MGVMNSSSLTNTVENLEEQNASFRVEAELSAHVSNGYSIVGINANSIPEMQAAIDNYVSVIKEKVEKLETEAETTIAFKGTEIDQALRNYMYEAEKMSLNMVSYLMSFRDLLDDVKRQYDKKDNDNASTINSRNEALQGLADAYGANAGNPNGTYTD